MTFDEKRAIVTREAHECQECAAAVHGGAVVRATDRTVTYGYARNDSGRGRGCAPLEPGSSAAFHAASKSPSASQLSVVSRRWVQSADGIPNDGFDEGMSGSWLSSMGLKIALNSCGSSDEFGPGAGQF